MYSNVSAIYIHIPFCKSKCHYCNFLSFINQEKYFDDYVNSLNIQIQKELSTSQEIETIYFGGGTPSLLEIKHFELIFATIQKYSAIANNAEITVEVNPATVDFDYLSKLRKIGVNRLSIGVQSFNNDLLRSINRLHAKDDAVNCIAMAKKARFENVSIDLIYGLPNQTLELWKSDLNSAINLDVQHISTYGLKIELGTYFSKYKPSKLPDEDLNADMYTMSVDFLEEHGFSHYEISNFAKNGFQGVHNLTYWKNQEYYGFGLGAHGYLDGKRYANSSNLKVYIANPTEKTAFREVSLKEKIEEEIFLGLRLKEGLNLEGFENKFGINFLQKYRHVIDKYSNENLLKIAENKLYLTTTGMLVSNFILADFLE